MLLTLDWRWKDRKKEHRRGSLNTIKAKGDGSPCEGVRSKRGNDGEIQCVLEGKINRAS